MNKIFISAGHTNIPTTDRGAFGFGYHEGDLAVELRNLIFEKMKIKPIIDSSSNPLAATIKFFKQLVNVNSYNFDIHFNSHQTTTASGCEVLIKDFKDKKANDIAFEISEIISKSGDFKNRGVKPQTSSHHGRLGFFSLTGNNFIIEICFISNPMDVSKYQNHKQTIAENLAKYFDNL